MSEHVRNLLLLRDGSADAELGFRRQIMRLLGGVPEPGLTALDIHRIRRVEGTVVVPDEGGDLTGLVMFAVGDGGRGALADVRSKSGAASARSLLVARGADFVILVTTVEPSAAMLEAAEAKSDLFYLGPVLRRRIWILSVPEIVARGERFLEERGAAPGRKGLWGWFTRTFAAPKDDVPVSPLQLRLEGEQPELEEPAADR